MFSYCLYIYYNYISIISIVFVYQYIYMICPNVFKLLVYDLKQIEIPQSIFYAIKILSILTLLKCRAGSIWLQCQLQFCTRELNILYSHDYFRF